MNKDHIEFLTKLRDEKLSERSQIDKDWSDEAMAEYMKIGNDICMLDEIIDTITYLEMQ